MCSPILGLTQEPRHLRSGLPDVAGGNRSNTASESVRTDVPHSRKGTLYKASGNSAGRASPGRPRTAGRPPFSTGSFPGRRSKRCCQATGGGPERWRTRRQGWTAPGPPRLQRPPTGMAWFPKFALLTFFRTIRQRAKAKRTHGMICEALEILAELIGIEPTAS